MVGLQFRSHELQRPAFVLLVAEVGTKEHENGSVGQTVADACQLEGCFAGAEVSKSYNQAED